MQYTFKIVTSNGVTSTNYTSSVDFSNCPFMVPYRGGCTCEEPEEIINAFWDTVDSILLQLNLSSNDFLYAINAYDENGKLYGALDT